MKEPSNQTERIAAALARPGVEVRETHISWVFLTGDRAYKLRKAVVFPFLDYGTPERRRHMCEEELRLGERFAPGLYLGLRAVVPDGDGFALADADRPDALEHVVEMRRFDEREHARRAARARRGHRDRRARGSRVASRRTTWPRSSRRRTASGRRRWRRPSSENFTTLLDFAEEIGDPRLGGRTSVRRRLPPRPARRVGGAAPRPATCASATETCVPSTCCSTDGKVEIFDPVEFDPALRLIDVAADLAFLVMELAEAGRADLAAALVDEYRAAGGDDGGDVAAGLLRRLPGLGAREGGLLARGGAADGRAAPAGAGACRSLGALAERLSWRARRPLVLVICGAAATGKTELAHANRGGRQASPT